MELSHDLPSRAARFLFTVVLAFAWCQGDRRAAGEEPGSAEGPPVLCCGATPADVEPTREHLERAAEVLERRLGKLGDAAAAMPRDTFDPAAVVATAGREPAGLLAWVREHTAFAPYRGALRGPRGVLMDRTGNSLDRALLLAELVASAGGTVRLARATLGAESAKALAAGGGEAPALARAPAPVPAAEQPAAPHADVAALAEKVKQRADEAARRVADQSARLVAALGNPAGGGDAAQAAADAAADHWWVQYESGGAWVNLDPSAPGAGAGAALSPAAETFPAAAPDAGEEQPRFDLPADLQHEVVVRVIVERSEGASKAERPVFEHALRPADVAGRRVTLRILPLNWPDADGIAAAKDPAARLKEIVVAQTGWAPALTVAGKQVVQRGFDTNGEVIDDPQPLPMATGAGVKKGVGGAIDLFGAGDAAPAPSKGVLSAAWVEFEARSPGRPGRRARRDVFDLLGPARRAAARTGVTPPNENQRFERGLALLGQTDVLVAGCDLSPEFAGHAALSTLAAQRENLVKMLRSGAGGAEEESTGFARRLEPFPAALYSLAVGRRAWDAPGAGGRRDVYVASPNVFCQHARLRHDAKEGIVSRLMLDVVHNDVAVRGGGGDAAAAFAARVRQGVLDTNVEALVLARRTPRVNTADLFEAGGKGPGGAGWVVLRGGKDAGWSKLSALPADVKARINQDLAAGYWAVVAPPRRAAAGARPAPEADIGWWRVDPETGTTVGIGATGHGISFTEYAIAAGSIAMAVIAFGGCGGFDRATGHGRRMLCLVCGVVAGALAMAFLGEYAAATAAAAATGTAATISGAAAAEAMAEFAVEGICNALDWATS